MHAHFFSAIPSTSPKSPLSWSSTSNHRNANIPGLPSYASHILNFDPTPALPRTRLHGERHSREQAQAGSPYASPYANRSPFAGSSTNSPFLSANSPFLSEHPTESKRNIHSPPPFKLEPSVNDWNTSNDAELFVNVSDLTSSRSSSANSPTVAALYRSAQQSSPHHYDLYVNTEQKFYSASLSEKRKRPSNALSAPSSPRPSPESFDAANVSSPESGSAYASSYNDDESYSDDSDSLYIPSPGRSRRSRPRKRARVSEDSHYEFVAQDGKKSRGRKVPVTQEFGAVEGNEAQVTILPSIPYGIKKTGSSNKNKRRYVCTFEGCGKCFVRGEHLKRHIKSLHLSEKPHECTFPGCTKSFSRKDNLKQHINIFHST